ncbi:hypothetical protein F5B17DRAFT_160877 [Nemania serpens]|nr:hypothetical protein F5B17DRAFT_160877 [Nemania serpens]
MHVGRLRLLSNFLEMAARVLLFSISSFFLFSSLFSLCPASHRLRYHLGPSAYPCDVLRTRSKRCSKGLDQRQA